MKKKYFKKKLSDNERLKRESNFLRGTIKKDLKNQLTGGFIGDNFQLIRFHGMYQQDNRDIRIERNKQKLEPLINMMLRCRLPGGLINSKQWLKIDKFSSKHTLYGSIRLTNRQTFQFHGILKKDIKKVHKMLNDINLDSIATAGDVNRNIVCTSNPYESYLHKEVYKYSKILSNYFLPKTKAYYEIWLDKKKIKTTEKEPILGSSYLPRKFKIGISIPPLNDIDINANDISLIAVSDNNKKLIGFNILVGGGLSISYGDKKTFPRISSEFGYVLKNDLIKITEAIITTQRDWGNRVNRKNAKTRYTLENKGVDKFIKEVEDRSNIKFKPIIPYIFKYRGDRFGWVKGIKNNWHLTLFIENGRILDFNKKKIKTGLKKIAKIHKGYFLITSNQNLIISNVKKEKKKIIENIAIKYGLFESNITLQKKSSMACVSLPTCPLAMAEAERFLPYFLKEIELIMFKNNLKNDSIILRISGCPNGCARALLAEIGLIGKAIGRYNLYLGGNYIGTRIPRLYKENITVKKIIFILNKMIKKWADNRKPKEHFGDYLIRSKIIKPVVNSSVDFYL